MGTITMVAITDIMITVVVVMTTTRGITVPVATGTTGNIF
jgi:hypothetical protein